MNIRIVTKKRKYLIIQLACASSSNWSSICNSRGCVCNNGIDVLIIYGSSGGLWIQIGGGIWIRIGGGIWIRIQSGGG